MCCSGRQVTVLCRAGVAACQDGRRRNTAGTAAVATGWWCDDVVSATCRRWWQWRRRSLIPVVSSRLHYWICSFCCRFASSCVLCQFSICNLCLLVLREVACCSNICPSIVFIIPRTRIFYDYEWSLGLSSTRLRRLFDSFFINSTLKTFYQ